MNTLLTTNGSNDLKSNIVQIIGRKKTQQLIEFNWEVPHCKIDGYITKYISSGSLSHQKINKDGIHCYLNRRPIDLPRKIVNWFLDIYRQFSQMVNPIIVLNFSVEDEYYDINVSPDKREVFLKNEREIIISLKEKLTEFFDNIQKSKLVQNLKNTEDGYNPTLNEQENDLVRNLQKKKVHKDDDMGQDEEEKVNKRQTAPQKTMAEYSQKFVQYHDSMGLKRKVKEQQQDSQNESSQKSDNSNDVPRIKRLKTDFELEWESQEEDSNTQSQKDKNQSSQSTPDSEQNAPMLPPSINKPYSSIKRDSSSSLEERTKMLKKANKFNQQERHQNFLSKFKAVSKRTNNKRKSIGEKKPEVEEQKEKPKDFMSSISRTFNSEQVKYVDKENDPTYEMNQAILQYNHDKMKVFKKQKIEIVNKSVTLDAELKPINGNVEELDITQTPLSKNDMKIQHPMDSEKLVFMDRLPITTGFDNSDTEVTLDISQLPRKIEREKLRFEELEKRRQENILHKTNSAKKCQNKSDFKSWDIDNNIIDVDEAKLDEMFGKEDFKKLEIIGQFNLGFILAVRPDTNQLFILDQHATDEKCKFEGFSKSTVIHSQTLIQ